MGKIILLTGAGSFIGSRVGKILSESGNIVYRTVSGERTKTEHDRHLINLNIVKEADCISALKKIIKIEGKLDALVNLAGITLNGSLENSSVSDLEKILAVNTVGTFRLTKTVLPEVKKTKGHIINVTSLNGLLVLPYFGLYSASKHALQALGETLYFELKSSGVRVTNIAPGAVYNPEGKGMSHKPLREKFKMLYRLMPMLTADQVAQKIVEVIEAESPPHTIVMGNDAKITMLLKSILPGWGWNKIVTLLYTRQK